MGDKVGRGLSGKDPSCLMKGLGIYSMGGGSHGRTVSRSRGLDVVRLEAGRAVSALGER